MVTTCKRRKYEALDSWLEIVRFIYRYRKTALRVAVYFPPNQYTDTPSRLFWLNNREDM